MRRGEVAVGVASRLIPGEGHPLLFEALASARRQVPGLRLFVAGEGPLRTQAEPEARRLAPGAVTFVGLVADIRAFMGACEVIAFPTEPVLGEVRIGRARGDGSRASCGGHGGRFARRDR